MPRSPFFSFQNSSPLSPFQICYDSPYFLKPPLSAGFKGGQRRFRSGGRPNKQGEAPPSPQKWRRGSLANSSVQSGSGQRAKEVVEESDGRTDFAVVPAGSPRRAARLRRGWSVKVCRVIRRRTAARKCLKWTLDLKAERNVYIRMYIMLCEYSVNNICLPRIKTYST